MPGGWLYYEPAGIGPAVVLLHSGNFDSRTWDPQFLALAAAHRVIRYAPAALSIFAGQRPVLQAHNDLLALLDSLHVARASLVERR